MGRISRFIPKERCPATFLCSLHPSANTCVRNRRLLCRTSCPRRALPASLSQTWKKTQQNLPCCPLLGLPLWPAPRILQSPQQPAVTGIQHLPRDALGGDGLLNNPSSCLPGFDPEMLMLHGRLIAPCGFNRGRIKAFKYILPTLLLRAA